MNPLRTQSITLLLLSVPFAVLGFAATDMAAWATAFVSVLCAFAVMALDWAVENKIL